MISSFALINYTNVEQATRDIEDVYEVDTTNKSTVGLWFARCRSGNFSLANEPLALVIRLEFKVNNLRSIVEVKSFIRYNIRAKIANDTRHL